MPHIVLEVPKSFDIGTISKIIKDSQLLLVNELPSKIESFKSRFYRYEHAITAGKDSNVLIHLEVKVLKGRAQELLCDIASKLREQILDILSEKGIDVSRYVVSVELKELSEAYVK